MFLQSSKQIKVEKLLIVCVFLCGILTPLKLEKYILISSEDSFSYQNDLFSFKNIQQTK